MDIRPISSQPPIPIPNHDSAKADAEALKNTSDGDGTNGSNEDLQEAFTDFVGQTLFGSMLASMRKTVGKPAYMHGGRTEEVFQQQLDQIIVEDMTDASADTMVGPMYDLFTMQRSR